MGMNGTSSPAQASASHSATERAVATLWAEVLDKQSLPDVDDNFFELGGDSIAMVTLLYRIQEELSVELPPGAVFGAPSVRELSALIDASETNQSANALESLPADQ